MALTLGAELAAAQESKEDRHPLVQITSSQWTDAIPFDGEYLNDSLSGENRAEAMSHTCSGGIVAVYSRDRTSGDDEKLHFLYTDEDRAIFTDIEIYNAGISWIQGASLVELPNCDIGIVFKTHNDLLGGTDYIKSMVVNITGEVVTAASNITSWDPDDYWCSAPHVVDFSGENYLLTYGYTDLDKNNNSGEHSIMYRTSSDFVSWSGAGELQMSGELVDTSRRDNPFVVAPDVGDMIIFFDYVDETRGDGTEIINIYKSSSSDYGVTWTSGEQVTTSNEYGVSSKNPSAALDSSNNMRLAYHTETSTMSMDVNTGGWCVTTTGDGGTYCNNSTSSPLMHFDPSTRKLFLMVTGYPVNVVCSVIIIDVDTWTVDDCYSSDTTPGYSSLFSDKSIDVATNRSSGPYMAANVDRASFVYNHTTDEFQQYFFMDYVTYGYYKNVQVDWRGRSTLAAAGTFLDGDSGKFYHLFIYTSGQWYDKWWFGYIDINEPADPITDYYDWHEIHYWGHSQEEFNGGGFEMQVQNANINCMRVVPEVGYILISSDYTGSLGVDADLKVLSLASCAQIKKYTFTDYSSFPKQGVRFPLYYDGFIYCSFPYWDQYGQQDRRGMLRIKVATDEMTYIQPPYGVSLDDYGLRQNYLTPDGRIIWSTSEYGVWIYDPADGSWTEYSNNTLPGFTEDGYDNMGSWGGLAYDPENLTIFASRSWIYWLNWSGLLAFSELGAFRQMRYRDAQWIGGNWVIGSENVLTLNYTEYDGSIIVDEEDVYWLFWTHLDGTERSIMWDNTGVTKDLSDYLTGLVEAKWAIDTPNELTFSCSEGHKFDPTNLLSAWSIYLRRGRKLTLRFGERISGTDYWQNQGTFVVEESQLTYQKGQYPLIFVTALDQRHVWSEGTIPATQWYDQSHPEYILGELLEDHARLVEADYVLPADGAMENSHYIWHQFVDMNLMEVIQEILDHFGYAHYYNMDGKFTIKYVDFTNEPDHYYTDNTRLINYTPDDSVANFVNRVIVKGEARYFLEVLFEEERIIEQWGTAGWWGVTEIKRHYYDEDEARTCRNPRVNIVESPTICIFFVKKGGGRIFISDEDVGETWVEVTVVCPDLIAILSLSIAAVIAAGFAALGCDWSFSCGAKIMALSLAIEVVCLILAAVANYRYEVYAQPVGHEKQTFQSSSDDTELQNELNGMIISQEIQDPFCYDLNMAKIVADQEMQTIKGQRRRVRFTKLAHLQDELMDIIEVPHPYSMEPLRYFIASLTRSYEKPDSPDAKGKFEDNIEGWKVIV